MNPFGLGVVLGFECMTEVDTGVDNLKLYEARVTDKIISKVCSLLRHI